MACTGIERLLRLLAPLALAGCAIYAPPELPAAQKATVHVSQYPYAINFEKIDGKDVALGSALRVVAQNTFEVDPGRHRVSIRIAMRFFEATYDGVTEVSFTAQPGKTYLIRAEPSSKDHQSCRAWAEESTQRLIDP
jgi:hypothetical protein